MKIFQKKTFLQKILISLIIIVLLFSIIVPKRVYAVSLGTLMQPIMSLFVGISDGVMSIMQKLVLGMDESIIEIDTDADFFAKLFVVLGTIALCAAVIVAAVLTGGTAAVIATAVIQAGAIATLTIGAVTLTFPILTTIVKGMLPTDLSLPLYTLSPENIFSNKIPMLDVDFFNPTDYDKEDVQSLNEKNTEKNISMASKLRPVISNWYVITRNIAIVASLSILVYLGIRILISSSAEDKSKYKQTIMDWVVSLCLIFCMHYIMAFSNIVVKSITEAIDVDSLKNTDKLEGTEVYYIADDKDRIKNAYKILVEEPAKAQNENEEEMYYYGCFIKANMDDDGNVTGDSELAGKKANILVWPAKNFLQQARLEAQISREKNKDDAYSEDYITIGWKLIYCVLVVYTVIFLWTYLKRVVYMAFLTIIAPLVAMTYPLDKLNDGSAQAFNMWLKEYIFNLMIQPMHLLLYTILVSSAFEFASKNILYVIVCLGFMTQAEKILRKFFGFTKADTPGILGGPAGAALMVTGMDKIFHRPPPPPFRGKKGPDGKLGGGASTGDDSGKVRTSGSFASIDGMNNTTGGGPTGGSLTGGGSTGGSSAGGSPTGGSLTGGGPTGAGPTGAGSTGNPAGATISPGNAGGNTNNKVGLKKRLKGQLAAANTKRKYLNRRFMGNLRKTKPSDYLKAGLSFAGKAAFVGASTAVGVTGGATAGIASGDPSKAAQYMALGGTAAFKKAQDTHLPKFDTSPELQEAMDRAKYAAEGLNYKEETKKKKLQEMENDPDREVRIKNEIGDAGYDFITQNDGFFYDNGLKDGKDADATKMGIFNYMQDNNCSLEEATNVARMAEFMGDTTQVNKADERAKMEERLVQKCTESDEYLNATNDAERERLMSGYRVSAKKRMRDIDEMNRQINAVK